MTDEEFIAWAQATRAESFQLRSDDISNTQLGENGFQEAERIKNTFADYLEDLITRAESNMFTINQPIRIDTRDKVDARIGHMRGVIKRTKGIVKRGLHNSEFPNERTEIIREATDHTTSLLRDCIPLHVHLQIEELRQTIDNVGSLKEVVDGTFAQFDAMKELNKQGNAILSSLRDAASRKAVQQGIVDFKTLSGSHGFRENCWFFGFLVAFGLTVWAFMYVAFGKPPAIDASLPQAVMVVSLILHRVLIISAPIIALRVTLQKYNTERHLRITYDHRQAVLERFKTFEGAIDPKDAAAKNALRLEVAKSIFSDPQTGYLGKDGAVEQINVNPMMSMVEKMTPSSG